MRIFFLTVTRTCSLNLKFASNMSKSAPIVNSMILHDKGEIFVNDTMK